MESYVGYIKTIGDALKLVEAARQGRLPLIQRRLTIDERLKIKSGSIFIFNASSPGLRRWTDGMRWSASRFNGHFLTYNQKKGGNADGLYGQNNADLIKKAITIVTPDNFRFGLISYYSNEDIDANKLKTPTLDETLSDINVPKNFYFRKVTHTNLSNRNNSLLTPLEENEDKSYNTLAHSIQAIGPYSKNQQIPLQLNPASSIQRVVKQEEQQPSLNEFTSPYMYCNTFPQSYNFPPNVYPSQTATNTFHHPLLSFNNYDTSSSHVTAAPQIQNKSDNTQGSILPPISVSNANERSYSSEDQRQLKAINSFF